MSSRVTAVTVASALLLSACATDVPTATSVAAKTDKTGGGGNGVSTVMSGLNSPRGLAFGPEGALYVAEAGTANVTKACVTLRFETCYSGTGSISRLWKGTQSRIITGMPSLYDGDAIGPSHIDFQGRGNGFVTIGMGAPPAVRAAFGSRSSEIGTVMRFTPNGAYGVVADVSAFENTDPDGAGKDSNPYGMLAEPGVQYVTDAGGNSLLKIVDGVVSLVATFPSLVNPPGNWPPRAQAVPTEVRRGPDGALYVSTLTGVPFLQNAARIYRVVEGEKPTVFADKLTTVTDFAFGPDGAMYVVQYSNGPVFFATPGSVVKIARDGTRSIVIKDLDRPTGVIVGPDGSVYVSNKGTSVGGGEVLRIAQ